MGGFDDAGVAVEAYGGAEEGVGVGGVCAGDILFVGWEAIAVAVLKIQGL